MSEDWLIEPMLAQEVSSNRQAIELLSVVDDSIRAEQKFDGVRLIVHVQEGKVIGINRKGAVTNIPLKIAERFLWFLGNWCFDGELVGGRYIVFDLARALDQVDPSMPFRYRRQVLESIWPSLDMPDCVQLARSTATPQDRLQLAQSVRDANGEGVMLKNADAPYRAGKRTKDCLKFKYWETVDCIVGETWREGKHSMSVQVVDESTGEMIDIGSVTMTADNLGKVETGTVVEVRYLYANDESAPRLYQSTFQRIRDDKSPAECLLSQLKYSNKEIA